MAAGDVFSDTEASLAPLTLVAIRPAVGVQVCITQAFAESASVNLADSASTPIFFADAGGNSSQWNHIASGSALKILMTNTEYIHLFNISAGSTLKYGYTGMEI